MNHSDLQKVLAPYPFQKIAYFDQVGSTNDVVAKWAQQGQDGLCLALADEQTQGRGRVGRDWQTPPGTALAMSFLMPSLSEMGASTLGRVNGLGALSVCSAIQVLYGIRPQIKWPNDVLLEGLKVCGVLAETHWQGEDLTAIILGIGINVAPNSVPSAKHLTYPAGSLEGHLKRTVDRLELLTSVVEALLERVHRLETVEFLAEWQERLAFKGQRVRLGGGSLDPVEGILIGLGRDGALRLETDAGEVKEFLIGEIQLRPVVKQK